MEALYFVLSSAQRKEISDTVFHHVSNPADTKFLYFLAHSILYCLARSQKKCCVRGHAVRTGQQKKTAI